MTYRSAYVRGHSADTAIHQFGLDIHYLVDSKDTEGRLTIVHYVSSPGHEPPPHLHEDEDEVFYVLEGELDAYCGDAKLHVKAGECLFLPFGKPHAWIIRSPVLRTLIVCHPARLDQAFRDMKELEDKVASSGQSYEEALAGEAGKQIMAIFAKHKLRILSPAEVREQMPRFQVTDSVAQPV
jgi:mannose-6-phosphate isomerase-like protein (cupin superfamily)